MKEPLFNEKQEVIVLRLIFDDAYRNKINEAFSNHAISLEDAIYFEDNILFEFICGLFDKGYKRKYIEKNFEKLLELHAIDFADARKSIVENMIK